MTGETRILRLFPTPVVTASVDGADEINAEIEAAILARMEEDKGVVRSNVGGWHSQPDLLSWGGAAGQRIVRAVMDLANEHTTNAQGKAVRLAWIVEAWANVSGSGHSNAAHIHGGAFWSAVYYVRADKGEGGFLTLHDTRMPALRMHAPGLRLRNAGPEIAARIRPQPGRIVLFPSWLSHSVDTWTGEGRRISIALNLTAPVAGNRGRAARPAAPKNQS